MAHQVYENEVLTNKINDILTTKVGLNSYMTIDTSLTENAGMKKKIRKYDSTGDIELLEQGEGNTVDGAVTYSETEYEVGTFQGRIPFFDEEEMTDPMVVETGLGHQADRMVNKFTALAIDEFKKATLVETAAKWSFDVVVDAIAKLNLEDESGLFMLISVSDKAALRKVLKDDLKYVEGFVRAGYIGSVCGVPVIISKAVPAGTAFIGTNAAVTVFIKKDTETEYEREANIRKNIYYIRKYGIVALTDATKLVKITIGSASQSNAGAGAGAGADASADTTE